MSKVGLLLSLSLVSLPAHALPLSQPVTLSEGEARVEPGTTASESDAPTSSSSTATLVQPNAGTRKGSFFRLFGIGAATTLVVTPLSMGLGAWIGTWSSNLFAALIPSLLIVMLVPPIVTVLVEHALGNLLWGKGTFKIGWPLLTGILLQVALVVVTALVGLPGATVPGIAIFTLFDLFILGGGTSAVMWATRVEPSATVATREEQERGGSAGVTELPRAPTAALTARF